jgi:hypothetical protein
MCSDTALEDLTCWKPAFVRIVEFGRGPCLLALGLGIFANIAPYQTGQNIVKAITSLASPTMVVILWAVCWEFALIVLATKNIRYVGYGLKTASSFLLLTTFGLISATVGLVVGIIIPGVLTTGPSFLLRVGIVLLILVTYQIHLRLMAFIQSDKLQSTGKTPRWLYGIAAIASLAIMVYSIGTDQNFG